MKSMQNKKPLLYALFTVILASGLFVTWRIFQPHENADLKLEDLVYLSYQEKPFGYYDPEKGIEDGIPIALLRLVWQELGLKNQPNISLQKTWAQAYKKSLAQPGIMLMGAFRTQAREDLFKWACPVYLEQMVFLGLKQSEMKKNNLIDYRNSKYGVLLGSASNTYLSNLHDASQQILRVNTMPLLLKMLRDQKVDLVVGAKQSLFYGWISVGGLPGEIEVYKVVDEMPICFAISKDVPDHIVKQFALALEKVVASKEYTKLKEKFLF